MKRLVGLLLAMIMLLSLCACSQQSEQIKQDAPDISQIKNICKLATLESYYHNVAKSIKDAGTGVSHLGEKPRKFWIQYTGVAKIGVDMSLVKMDVDGSDITITIPKASLIDLNIDSATLNEESYISSADGLNPNNITAEDQTTAIDKAQEEMKKSIEDNFDLMTTAQERAKELIEAYIIQLGTEAGVEYNITWVEIPNQPIETPAV